MSTLTHLTGDATRPVGPGSKIIVHCCNDIGAWGAGFVLALSRRWPQPETEYRTSARVSELVLGEIQLVPVEQDITVVNLIGQHGTGHRNGVPPIRYEAISEGLSKLAVHARHHGASVHMPKMGAGLAGGDWDQIEEIVRNTLCAAGIPVFVYTFDP
ncbi:putative phosphatase, C-terminal domain of histone macro H2A1 like protein [Opitutaceae bacterium TAV1]|nr:putative phosphatase, C-terminal domain of histone macro H2A1 like protein [Opitutaceae bacterium TAV1]